MPASFTAGIYLVDFEYHPVNGVEGNSPDPVCMVVCNLKTGVVGRYFREQLKAMEAVPFHTGPNSLFVAYYAPAELDCFIALGWSLPVNILDLYVEFRNNTNGLPLKHGSGLLGAMVHFGLRSIAVEEKVAMRDLILSRGPWTTAQKTAILDYCESDVDALGSLFLKMQPLIDWPRALLRGRYTKAVSSIQRCGIPIDVPELARVQQHWAGVREQLGCSIHILQT